MKLIFLFLITFSFASSYSQDTTIQYPLKVGNYWEYWTQPPQPAMGFYDIISREDTMPNGKSYFYLYRHLFGQGFYGDMYLRFESNKAYSYAPSEFCADSEYVYCDFTKPDRELWPICIFTGVYKGILSSYYKYYSIFQKELYTRVFSYAVINGNDTTWNPMGETGPAIPFAIGVGPVYFDINEVNEFYLTGAILDGKKYGTITNIKEDIPKVNEKSFQIYPNPTNGYFKISFNLSEASKVKLILFNSLGERVREFVKDSYSIGDHLISINISDITSGVYFVTLIRDKEYSVKRLTILK